MNGVVSIIIPCCNGERWIRDAVESCLAQSHPTIEVVVVDDGSTDRSVEILKSYGDRIKLVSTPRQGANRARNRGVSRSTGDYIQFLDADDYLLKDKIARQVEFLNSSSVDVVYGDWRHQHNRPGGSVEMESIVTAGAQEDFLEALLSGWWVPLHSYLFRRRVVEGVIWNEDLTAAQDRDFAIKVALSGAKIGYQPGCGCIYRRYGEVTTSTGNRQRWLENHRRVLQAALQQLRHQDRLIPKYRSAIAQSYFALARNYFDIDRSAYRELMSEVVALDPMFRARESLLYNTAQRLFGYSVAEHLARLKHRLLGRPKPTYAH